MKSEIHRAINSRLLSYSFLGSVRGDPDNQTIYNYCKDVIENLVKETQEGVYNDMLNVILLS